MLTYRQLFEMPILARVNNETGIFQQTPFDHPSHATGKKDYADAWARGRAINDEEEGKMGWTHRGFMGHHMVTSDDDGHGQIWKVHDARKGRGDKTLQVNVEHENGKHVVRSLHREAEGGPGAHELYHHMVANHGMTLVSDDVQTMGGAKTWHKLSQMPGVKVGMISQKGVEHPLEPEWRGNFQGLSMMSRFIARKA